MGQSELVFSIRSAPFLECAEKLRIKQMQAGG